MDEAETLTDRMCACKDEACADKVREDRRDMKKKFRASMKSKKPSSSQIERADKLDDKWRSCSAKLESHS